MAYFKPYIDAEGIHIPTYNEIMEYLIEKYKEIFGQDVYIKEDTKDYQFLSVFAYCIDDISALAVDCYNSRNPNYATGASLDLLLPLVSMRRQDAAPSKALLTLGGTPGTVITTSESAIDAKGNIWNIDEEVTLDENGDGEVMATCSVAGAIDAPIGTINEIYTPIIGWDSVTNEAAAIVGRNVETDDALRLRRKRSVNTQNNGSYDALMRVFLNIEINGEVIDDVRIYVNDTNQTDANGIPGHSICCVLKGLNDYEYRIAEEIWKTKAPGVGTYGGPAGATRRSINYVDAYGNTDVINFARPVEEPVSVVVTLNALDGYDDERVESIIKSAVENSINGLGIGDPWGVTTAYKDIYNAFAGEQCPFVIASVTGKTSSMLSPDSITVPCGFNQLLTCGDSDITITVNQ